MGKKTTEATKAPVKATKPAAADKKSRRRRV
jgi:hypothetical protein